MRPRYTGAPPPLAERLAEQIRRMDSSRQQNQLGRRNHRAQGQSERYGAVEPEPTPAARERNRADDQQYDVESNFHFEAPR